MSVMNPAAERPSVGPVGPQTYVRPPLTPPEKYEKLAFTFCRMGTVGLIAWALSPALFVLVVAIVAIVLYAKSITLGVSWSKCFLRRPTLIIGVWAAIAVADAIWLFGFGGQVTVAYRRLAFNGGTVEYLVAGADDARDLLLFHPGSPSAAVAHPGLVRAATAAGMRVASYSRGGYGASTRRHGRSVADEVAISAALAERLGYERFFTLGLSGGGPVALACAALLPDRVRACLALASLAPPVEAGPEWDTFWSPAQLADWQTLATGNVASLLPDFREAVEIFGRMTPTRLAAIGGPPDVRAISHGFATEVRPSLVRGIRRAVSRGYFGYLDDNLAQARDWGFQVADIHVPVVVRHGELDRLVPVAHGRWLAEAIPGARGVFLDDAGHGSIALPWSETIAQLLEAAG